MVEVTGKTIGELDRVTSITDATRFLACSGTDSSYVTL